MKYGEWMDAVWTSAVRVVAWISRKSLRACTKLLLGFRVKGSGFRVSRFQLALPALRHCDSFRKSTGEQFVLVSLPPRRMDRQLSRLRAVAPRHGSPRCLLSGSGLGPTLSSSCWLCSDIREGLFLTFLFIISLRFRAVQPTAAHCRYKSS